MSDWGWHPWPAAVVWTSEVNLHESSLAQCSEFLNDSMKNFISRSAPMACFRPIFI